MPVIGHKAYTGKEEEEDVIIQPERNTASMYCTVKASRSLPSSMSLEDQERVNITIRSCSSVF
jgi:hypothetical protein